MNKLSRYLACLTFLLVIGNMRAGGIVNNGAVIKLNNGISICIDGSSDGDFVNQTSNSTDGTLTGDGTIYLEGDWSNNAGTSGIFTNSSTITVNLNGADQSLSGSTSFPNLTKNAGSATTLTFPAGASGLTTVTGVLNLQGADGQTLSLRSSVSGTQWQIDPQGTRTIGYLDVMDSHNTNASAIDAIAANCVDAGNNTNWTFIQTYLLTVSNGTGGGDYAAGTSVTIAADAAASGKVFDQWTGDTSYIADVTASSTTVTMPGKAISATATYKDQTYALTVVSGTGSGSYTSGTTVMIEAVSSELGLVFQKWTGDTDYVVNPYMSLTMVTIPETDITLTANYTIGTDTKYKLTVTNGSGSGKYLAGALVPIEVDPAPDGQVFDAWTGDVEFLVSPYSYCTSVAMPGQAISITATYKDTDGAEYALVVNNGNGSGSYAAGEIVSIVADGPSAGKVFSCWSGDVGFLVDPYSPETALSMPGQDMSVAAAYEDVVPEVTVAPLNAYGTVSPSGVSTLAYGGSIRISATANEGYTFESWSVNGSATIEDSLSATTTITVYDDTQVLATFIPDVEPTQTQPSLRISTTNMKDDHDSVKLCNMPLSIGKDDFDPLQELTVTVDGDEFSTMACEMSVSRSGDRYIYKSVHGSTPKIKLCLNFKDADWDFSVSHASVTHLNHGDGITCALWFSTEKVYGDVFVVSEKTTWKFSAAKDDSQPLLVSGNTMAECSITKASGSLNSDNDAKCKLKITKATFDLGDGQSFDAATDQVVITADDYSLTIPPGSFTQNNVSRQRYMYQDKDNGVSMTLDLDRQLWTLSVKGVDCDSVDMTDGLEMTLTVGDYTGGQALSNEYKTTLSY